MITTQTPLASPPPSPLEHATRLALAALTDILADPEASHRERRLAAVAILKHAAAVEPKPASSAREHHAKPSRTKQADEQANHDAVCAMLATEYTEIIDIAYHRGYDDALAAVPSNPPDHSAVILEQFTRRRDQAAADTPDPFEDHPEGNPPHAN